jgi:O-antigen ligase
MLLKLSKFFLYVSVFSVVVVMASSFFPFIGGKDYFFRFSIELALIFFVLWLAFQAKSGEARTRFGDIFRRPIFIAVSVFVLVFLLASIFAYDPHAAFWSNYERGEGGFQMIHYYAFFVLMVLLLETKDDWRKMFKASVVAAIPMILYGVLGNFGVPDFISVYAGIVPPTTAWGKLVVGRFAGSLGNPAYTAPYLFFSMFYVAFLWVDGKSKKIFTSIGYAALFLIFLLFFFLSQTRGALLGLSAAVFLFLVYLAFSRPAWRKRLVILLIVLGLCSVFLIRERQSEFVRDLPGGRIFDIAFSDQTVQTRLWTWGSAWKGFLEKPVLGWGPENFSTVFDRYFDPRHYVPGKNTETWFDRAHSIYFDYLAETGILGLLGYLAIFVIIYREFFRKNFGAKKHSVVSNALVFSLPFGYLIQGVAIFDVLPMYVNLFLFFAFCFYYFYSNESNA